jgi:hypothetical protein
MNTEQLFRDIQRREQDRAEKMSDTKAALRQMFEAYQRLRDLGWNDAIYCPKDGTTFDSISAGSTGVHDCFYRGEWPKGGWWGAEAGDIWPSSPILFKLKKEIKVSIGKTHLQQGFMAAIRGIAKPTTF